MVTRTYLLYYPLLQLSFPSAAATVRGSFRGLLHTVVVVWWQEVSVAD